MLEDLLDHLLGLDKSENSYPPLALGADSSVWSRPRRLEGPCKTLVKNLSNLTIDKLLILFFYNQYEFRSFDWLLNFLNLDTTF